MTTKDDNKAYECEQNKRKILECLPCVPFKNIEKFYDIGGLLAKPIEFKMCVDMLISRYRNMQEEFTSIGCFDARGFLLAPSIALALGKPLFMLRKKDKMPNTMPSLVYSKEYKGDGENDMDDLCLQKDSIKKGDNVILIDDLIATGGTLKTGIDLIVSSGGNVLECGFLVELPQVGGRKFVKQHYPNVEIWSLLKT